MRYLNDDQHYIDRYDLHTIEECLRVVRMFQDVYQKSLKSKELKHLSEEEKERSANIMLHRTLFAIKGKKYEQKEATIKKWMDEDQLKQDKQDFTPTPEDVVCPLCSGPMFFNTTKHLDHTLDSQLLRMMFLFKCSKCKKQQWVYDDGEIRVSKPDLCPECNKELVVASSREKKLITTTYTCKSCKYSKKDVYDFAKSDAEHKKWEEEQKQEAEKDKKLLEKYRSEFCLSNKEGKEHIETLEALEVANEVYEEEKQKYDETSYQVVVNLKRLAVLEVEKLLSEKLAKDKYVKFTLEKPDMGKFVTIPFTVLDANSSRRQNISEANLKSLIKETLEDTNWRLMGNDIHYRLGYLSGTLKAYEQEEDLIKLVGANKKIKPPISKVDPEKKTKYSHHNLVQLARLSGELEGIEATRKKRLEKEPEGFFLNDGKSSYTCGICGEHYDGKDIWWNLDGLRCRDCRRNIVEGVIPSLKHSKHDDKADWFDKFEITSNRGVHPSSVRKLVRERVLRGRDLKRADGTVYHTIYLVSENQDFLTKYPKKKSDIKMTIADKEGKSIEL